MADVATRLRKFLLSQTAITALIDGRVFETKPPDVKIDPYIVFDQNGSENADTLGGSNEAPLFHSVQIRACGRDLTKVRAINDALRTAMHQYRGAFDDTTAKGVFVDSQSVDLERFADGSDSGYFIGSSETRIFL